MAILYLIICTAFLVKSSSDIERYQTYASQLFNQEQNILMEDEFGKEYNFQVWLKSNNFAIYHHYEPSIAELRNKPTPGLYVVTRNLGAQSTNQQSKYSEDINLYSVNTTLEIINVVNIPWEKRIRGQVKDTLDWVSIKNTQTGFMWVKPVVPKKLIEFEVLRYDSTRALVIEFSKLQGISEIPTIQGNIKNFFKMFEKIVNFSPYGIKLELKDYYSSIRKDFSILETNLKFIHFFKYGNTFFEQFNFHYVQKIKNKDRDLKDQILGTEEISQIYFKYPKIGYPWTISELIKQIQLISENSEEFDEIFDDIFISKLGKRFFDRFPVTMVYQSKSKTERKTKDDILLQKRNLFKMFSSFKSKTTTAPGLEEDNFL